MGPFLIAAVVFAGIFLWGWIEERVRVNELRQKAAENELDLCAFRSSVVEKDNEIQSLTAQLAVVTQQRDLFERRAAKPGDEVVRAKNWKQVLTINEHDRAEKEHEEELKHANTERR